MYKDRNQLLFFLFLFPNLQENYLSNVVCTVMDVFVLHRIFYGSKRTGAATIEKKEKKV